MVEAPYVLEVFRDHGMSKVGFLILSPVEEKKKNKKAKG
jgi:hypothetical protein